MSFLQTPQKQTECHRSWKYRSWYKIVVCCSSRKVLLHMCLSIHMWQICLQEEFNGDGGHGKVWCSSFFAEQASLYVSGFTRAKKLGIRCVWAHIFWEWNRLLAIWAYTFVKFGYIWFVWAYNLLKARYIWCPNSHFGWKGYACPNGPKANLGQEWVPYPHRAATKFSRASNWVWDPGVPALNLSVVTLWERIGRGNKIDMAMGSLKVIGLLWHLTDSPGSDSVCVLLCNWPGESSLDWVPFRFLSWSQLLNAHAIEQGPWMDSCPTHFDAKGAGGAAQVVTALENAWGEGRRQHSHWFPRVFNLISSCQSVELFYRT